MVTEIKTAFYHNTSLYKSNPKFAPNIKKKQGNLGLVFKMITSGNFSIKSYVVAIFKNRLSEAILFDSHNI